jgi:dihydrofolate reductase
MEKNMIKAILAHDAKYGIGKDNDLPWPKNEADMKWFKAMTLNHTVVMGRKTWDSLPFKPLPNRHNIIVTSNEIDTAGLKDHRRSSFETLRPTDLTRLEAMKDDIWIIGGATLIASSLDMIDELWLNNVGGDYECDTFLPEFQIKQQFVPHNILLNGLKVIKWVRKNKNSKTNTINNSPPQKIKDKK